jgi:SAM-dependent methyltransferase
MPGTAGSARYDGLADWYDAQLESAPHRDQVLRTHLPAGAGPGLDIGCGTGRNLPVIAELGWTPIGLELSADQLRLARGRGDYLIQGDAQRLPFQRGSFSMAVSTWTSTDVERFDWMLAEAARVLRPGGTFLFYGVHPCFNGPHVETGPEGSRIVHATYREAKRHTSSPWWGTEGIRVKAGGMRHLPLAEFMNAFFGAGFVIQQIVEPDEDPVPYAIVVTARKPTEPATRHE